MRSGPTKRPPSSVTWWLIAIAMVLTISGQVVSLVTQATASLAGSWTIIIGSSLILAYAAYRLAKLSTDKH